MMKYSFQVPIEVSVSWPYRALDEENARKLADFMRDEVQKRLARPEYHDRLQAIVREATEDVERQCVVDVEKEDLYIKNLLGGNEHPR